MRRTKTMLLAAVVLLAAGVGAGLLWDRAPEPLLLETEEARLAYLRLQGWEGALLSEQPVTVPSDWTGLEDYASLQDKQGLPLREAAGTTGVVYTYSLAGTRLRAELLTAGGSLVGAQCYDPETGKILPVWNGPGARAVIFPPNAA